MNTDKLKIAIDCDDAAIDLKNVVYEFLKSSGVNIVDLNYGEGKTAMYPEIGYNLALKIKNGEYDQGILNRVEMAIRAYDPCLSCATHALDGRIAVKLDIRDAKGNLVASVKN